jgi:hypothetical protein
LERNLTSRPIAGEEITLPDQPLAHGHHGNRVVSRHRVRGHDDPVAVGASYLAAGSRLPPPTALSPYPVLHGRQTERDFKTAFLEHLKEGIVCGKVTARL